LFLERLLKGFLKQEEGKREEEGFKKRSDKFSESQKVCYFCTPPLRKIREKEKGD
jgi:hypothetical protein